MLTLVIIAIGLLILRDPGSFKITLGLGLLPIAAILAVMWSKRKEVELNSESIVPELD